MTFLLYFALFYSLIFLILIIGLIRMRVKNIKGNNITLKEQNIYVIIACKDEENNIDRLIESLKEQSYSKNKFKVILADDNSADNTASVIKNKIKDIDNFHYLYVPADCYQNVLGKKKALTYAIEYALSEDTAIDILAFTDADCLPEKDWLIDINKAFLNDYDFYAGYSPIDFPDKDKLSNIYSRLKNMERASIFAVSAAGFGMNIPLTCTARNIAYHASLWKQTKGFSGIEHILSGDDDLMLHKSSNYINKTYFSFNQNAIVHSTNENNLSKQYNQEIRRASKFLYYPLYIKLLIISVIIFYIFLIYNIIYSIINLTFSLDLFYSLTLKVLFEFMFLFLFLMFIKKIKLIRTFLLAQILYIPYFLFFGIMGSFGKYKWKN